MRVLKDFIKKMLYYVKIATFYHTKSCSYNIKEDKVKFVNSSILELVHQYFQRGRMEETMEPIMKNLMNQKLTFCFSYTKNDITYRKINYVDQQQSV